MLVVSATLAPNRVGAQQPAIGAAAGDVEAAEPRSDRASDATTGAEADEAQPTDPFLVPDGSPDELVEYTANLIKDHAELLRQGGLIDALRQARPGEAGTDGEQEKQAKTDRQRMLEAIETATDRILASPEPTQAQLEFVTMITLELFGDEAEKLDALAGRLRELGYPELARNVQRAVLQRRLHDVMVDPGPNPQQKLQRVVDEVVAFLEAERVTRRDAGLAFRTAMLVERVGDSEFAIATLQRLIGVFSRSDHEQVAELAEKLQGIVRRLQLPGSKMELSGTTVEGDPIDISRYEGKLVLVDFWASWCGPCRVALPHLLELYEAYHDRGFEVIAPSVDRDRDALEAFLDENPLPWPVIWGEDGPAEAAEYYGIVGIPTYMLVGPDGKVISASVNRARLDEILAERLGPMEAEDDGPVANDDEE